MNTLVLGLGSNLGARRAYLRVAERLLSAVGYRGDRAFRRLARSKAYENPPFGGKDQPDYLNAAVAFESAWGARAWLPIVAEIEGLLGRTRQEHWGSRVLDIDILFSSEPEIREPDLVVPHPGLLERKFAVGPMLEVLPEAQRCAFETRHASALQRLGALSIAGERFPIATGFRQTTGDEIEVRGQHLEPNEALAAAMELMFCAGQQDRECPQNGAEVSLDWLRSLSVERVSAPSEELGEAVASALAGRVAFGASVEPLAVDGCPMLRIVCGGPSTDARYRDVGVETRCTDGVTEVRVWATDQVCDPKR